MAIKNTDEFNPKLAQLQVAVRRMTPSLEKSLLSQLRHRLSWIQKHLSKQSSNFLFTTEYSMIRFSIDLWIGSKGGLSEKATKGSTKVKPIIFEFISKENLNEDTGKRGIVRFLRIRMGEEIIHDLYENKFKKGMEEDLLKMIVEALVRDGI